MQFSPKKCNLVRKNAFIVRKSDGAVEKYLWNILCDISRKIQMMVYFDLRECNNPAQFQNSKAKKKIHNPKKKWFFVSIHSISYQNHTNSLIDKIISFRLLLLYIVSTSKKFIEFLSVSIRMMIVFFS
jgi:hypothetical protein